MRKWIEKRKSKPKGERKETEKSKYYGKYIRHKSSPFSLENKEMMDINSDNEQTDSESNEEVKERERKKHNTVKKRKKRKKRTSTKRIPKRTKQNRSRNTGNEDIVRTPKHSKSKPKISITTPVSSMSDDFSHVASILSKLKAKMDEIRKWDYTLSPCHQHLTQKKDNLLQLVADYTIENNLLQNDKFDQIMEKVCEQEMWVEQYVSLGTKDKISDTSRTLNSKEMVVTKFFCSPGLDKQLKCDHRRGFSLEKGYYSKRNAQYCPDFTFNESQKVYEIVKQSQRIRELRAKKLVKYIRQIAKKTQVIYIYILFSV